MMSRFGLGDRWGYLDMVKNEWHGVAASRARALYREAAALFNLCGATRLRHEHLACPVRLYIETDPMYEQIKLAQGDTRSREFLEAHTHHATYAENLGRPGCPIPVVRFDWKATRPPVVVDLWPLRPAPAAAAFTSVATWKNVGKDIVYNGQRYHWSKHENFLKVIDLPRRTGSTFELAMDTGDADTRALLHERGWRLVDPFPRSRDLESYAAYITASRGEFTVAKDLYVQTHSGWFSDRSVCYLAAGKPVITQETGFTRFIPSGRGLLAFERLEDAVEAVRAVEGDYEQHCQAAREVATEHFAAEAVLSRLLRDAGLSA
jgi:hypothetical protein